MRDLENLIEQYVNIRRRRHSFISTGLAVKALKQIVPACSISDSDLANMIADRAIDYNLPVRFDLNAS
ncbi:MAG: hypothetical protein E5Y88_14910 [Mesorhizobium sp.]|uniref:hypothetical protein n=1 Tax=Mesorhizobium TaxID=68287 RepID=UPI000FCAADB3|nr:MULTISPECIES: hypothetical protein [Mesorhizobium]RUU25728.1 hypothetical protein EOC94_30230 [Mesorhizobium sp. M6A.T.Ce.TU.016.01.1.1]RUU44590.1 hypothetical protein EOC93_10580 [Mesorhizobium sp. M6A.T.Ce.TU.002.03.1.1]RWN33354.1 MAG: hypothetical protein EOR95_15470 [Mesorhizobium sp.]RWN36233.1 MAG: hypothetical protein EOR96_25590 [Mesorhizobium sp.]RWN66230.1 MAG: hypothetical protein EOR99_17665 [Mesorhizobium sp.]